MVKKFLVDDDGIYNLSDYPEPPHWGPEISFDFPVILASKIKKYINKYNLIQSFFRELVRIGVEEKEYYEKEQIEKHINDFDFYLI